MPKFRPLKLYIKINVNAFQIFIFSVLSSKTQNLVIKQLRDFYFFLIQKLSKDGSYCSFILHELKPD